MPFSNLLPSDCTLAYRCLAPFNFGLSQHRYTREQHLCDLAKSPFFVLSGPSSLDDYWVHVIAGGSSLHHVHHVHTPCKRAHFIMHCISLSSVVLMKIELDIPAQALRHCTILTCLQSYHVSSLHVGHLLFRPRAVVCNTCWIKLRYCRWLCLTYIHMGCSHTWSRQEMR